MTEWSNAEEFLRTLYYQNATVWKAGRTTWTTTGHVRPLYYKNDIPGFIDLRKCDGVDRLVFRITSYGTHGDSGGTVYTYYDNRFIILGIYICNYDPLQYAVPVTYINEDLGVYGYEG